MTNPNYKAPEIPRVVERQKQTREFTPEEESLLEMARPHLSVALNVFLGHEPLRLVLGRIDQPGGVGIRYGGHDDQVTQAAQDVLGEPTRVLTGLDHLVDDAEDSRPVDGGERVDDLVEQVVGGVAEQAGGDVVRDAVGSGPTEQLVEH